MREYDDAVLECFLDKQLQLFPEAVAETLDEAEDFLEECMACLLYTSYSEPCKDYQMSVECLHS